MYHLAANPCRLHQARRGCRTLLLAAVATLLGGSGCGPGVDDVGPPGDSIRGEPIRAAPAASPATSTPPSLTSVDQVEATVDPAEDNGGLLLVGFDRLAGYDYEAAAAALDALGTNAPPGSSAIPASVRALDGREVAIKGFMLPLTLEGGLVTEFLLMRDQSMCCFGVLPRMNDWVNVRMKGRGVKSIMDQPVTVLGVLRVGEVIQSGILSCIYEMTGEELLDALDL